MGHAIISPDGVYRYRLTRVWDTRRPVLVWVMLNPSTADATTDDPTVRRCTAFARAWGYGGIEVVNLFALRATSPAELRTHADPAGPLCDAYLACAVVSPGAVVVLAWGANADHPPVRGRARDVLAMLQRRRVDVRCLGVTAGGHPVHPGRLASTVTLRPWTGVST
jgi:hypothetical protein